MKKSLLALAVAVTSTQAMAATVYDKNETTLAVGGRIQAVVYNGNSSGIADHDAGLVNSARLNIDGKTKINDYLSAFAFTEWDMADGNTSDMSNGEHISTRDQYVGADFGSFGKVSAGKMLDSLYSVQEATDIFEDFGAVLQGTTNADRRTGVIKYDYDNNGLFASVTYQTAQDGVSVGGEDADLESGYSVAVGYTFDDVFFGPLAFKVAHSYLRGQNDRTYAEDGSYSYSNRFDSFKDTAVSISWGTTESGPYFAALYESIHERQNQDLGVTDPRTFQINKQKGFELVGGYTFECGLGVFTGYELSNVRVKLRGEAEPRSEISRRVPLYVNYAFNENFNVWSEAEFDANSSDNVEDKGTKLAVGARYTF